VKLPALKGGACGEQSGQNVRSAPQPANQNFHGTIRCFGFAFKKYMHSKDFSRAVRKKLVDQFLYLRTTFIIDKFRQSNYQRGGIYNGKN
jgi:hypothetical protein